MGTVLCKNLQTQIQQRCSKCRVLQGYRVFISFTTCKHQFCKKCLGVNDVTCPIQEMNKSIISKGIQMFERIGQTSQTFRQFCNKNHEMIWKAQQRICKKCFQESHGFQCKQCLDYICTHCIKKYTFNSLKQCPNNHLCEWGRFKKVCLWCGQSKHGWRCKACQFIICTSCSQIPFSKQRCPNQEALTWTNEKFQCLKCHQHLHGWKCKNCQYQLCSICANTSFQQLRCPNSHKTKFKSEGECLRCGLRTKVMRCQKCNYNFCTKCQLIKYSTNRISTLSSDRDYLTKKSQAFMVTNILYKQEQHLNDPEQAIGTGRKQGESSIDISKLRYQARKELSTQNYTLAIQKYKECTDIQPKNIQNWLDLGESYQLNKQFIDAIQVYNRIQTYDKQNVEGLMRLNRLIISQKNNNFNQIKPAKLELLLSNCNRILEKQENEIQTNIIKGKVQVIQGRKQEALKCFRKAQIEQQKVYREKNESKHLQYNALHLELLVSILKSKFQIFRNSNQYIKTLIQIQKIIDLYNQYKKFHNENTNRQQLKDLYIIKGQIYQQLGDTKSAQEAYKQAIK